MVYEHDDDEITKWTPTKDADYCCSQCGINHEARDFVRAMSLHLIDHFERNNKFINEEVYQNIHSKTEKNNCELKVSITLQNQVKHL